MANLPNLVVGDLQRVSQDEAGLIAASPSRNVPGAPITGTGSPSIGQPSVPTLSSESVSSLFSAISRSLAEINSTLQSINANVAGIVAGQVGSNLGSVDVGLPTEDPAIAGALWSDSGIVTVSSGP